ncbi:hypothetical protein [Vibrio phage vB_VpaS_AL-2]|nr:hypothetical protein [Vibrio phage vB_VpaS_AL-2]
MATLTELRVKKLQDKVRNARVEMQAAEESLQYARAMEDGQTINLGSAIGSFDMSKEQLVAAAEKTYKEKKGRYNVMCNGVDNFLTGMGIEL